MSAAKKSHVCKTVSVGKERVALTAQYGHEPRGLNVCLTSTHGLGRQILQLRRQHILSAPVRSMCNVLTHSSPLEAVTGPLLAC
jgi:hypothetical protein